MKKDQSELSWNTTFHEDSQTTFLGESDTERAAGMIHRH